MEDTKTLERTQLRSLRGRMRYGNFLWGVELLNIGGRVVGRIILQPGWRWSTSVRPIAKTESCEAPHFQYQVSGVLAIRMDDGTEFELHPGDVSYIAPGHDAWVVGDDPVVLVDFQGMIDYAKPH